MKAKLKFQRESVQWQVQYACQPAPSEQEESLKECLIGLVE